MHDLDTRYAASTDGHVGYQVIGSGLPFGRRNKGERPSPGVL